MCSSKKKFKGSDQSKTTSKVCTATFTISRWSKKKTFGKKFVSWFLRSNELNRRWRQTSSCFICTPFVGLNVGRKSEEFSTQPCSHPDGIFFSFVLWAFVTCDFITARLTQDQQCAHTCRPRQCTNLQMNDYVGGGNDGERKWKITCSHTGLMKSWAVAKIHENKQVENDFNRNWCQSLIMMMLSRY